MRDLFAADDRTASSCTIVIMPSCIYRHEPMNNKIAGAPKTLPHRVLIHGHEGVRLFHMRCGGAPDHHMSPSVDAVCSSR